MKFEDENRNKIIVSSSITKQNKIPPLCDNVPSVRGR